MAELPAWERYELSSHYLPASGRLVVKDTGLDISIDRFIRRRLAGEPLEYILGHCHIDDIYMKTDRRALIPRPETETLVRRFVKREADLPAGPLVDCGTGSGFIAGWLSSHLSRRVIATEIDREALGLAVENAKINGWPVEFIACDRLRGIKTELAAIVANLPYVFETTELAPAVRDYEPKRALIPPGDPGVFFRGLLVQAAALLKVDGELWLEGSKRLFDLLINDPDSPLENWRKVRFENDNYHRQRFLLLKK